MVQVEGLVSFFLFFNDTATTEIYTLSLHDALPISVVRREIGSRFARVGSGAGAYPLRDRKSTRLNSSHGSISYAVFCFKQKHIMARAHARILQTAGTRRAPSTFQLPVQS